MVTKASNPAAPAPPTTTATSFTNAIAATHSTPKKSKHATAANTSAHSTPRKHNPTPATIAASSEAPSEAGTTYNTLDDYCDRCYRHFPSVLSLEQHLSDSPFHNICSTCLVDFTSKSLLQKHLSNGKIQCTVTACKGMWFCTLEEFKWHNETEEGHNYCYDCNKNFETENGLEDHQAATPHPGRDLQCVCGGYYPTISSLFHHVERNVCPGISPHMLFHLFYLMTNFKPEQFVSPPSAPSTAGNFLFKAGGNGKLPSQPLIWDLMNKLHPNIPPSKPTTTPTMSTKFEIKKDKKEGGGGKHPQTNLPMELYNDTMKVLDGWISVLPAASKKRYQALPVVKKESMNRPSYLILVHDNTGVMRKIPFPSEKFVIRAADTHVDAKKENASGGANGEVKGGENNDAVYKCHTCQYQFSQQSVFMRHFHLGKGNVGNVHGKMDCVACGREFWTLSGYIEHKEKKECGMELEEMQKLDNATGSKMKKGGEFVDPCCLCPFCSMAKK